MSKVRIVGFERMTVCLGRPVHVVLAQGSVQTFLNPAVSLR